MYMRATWDLHGTYTGFTWDPCRTNMYVLHKDLHGIRTGSHGSYMGTAWELHESYMQSAQDHLGSTRIHVEFPWTCSESAWEIPHTHMGSSWDPHGSIPPHPPTPPGWESQHWGGAGTDVC